MKSFAQEVLLPYWRAELRRTRKRLAKLRAEQARNPRPPLGNVLHEAFRAVFSPTYVVQPTANNPTNL